LEPEAKKRCGYSRDAEFPQNLKYECPFEGWASKLSQNGPKIDVYTKKREIFQIF